MHISTRAMATGLALCLAPASAQAQEADTSFALGEITVTAKGMAGSTNAVLTSIDRLGGDTAQKADVANAWELIGRMPGVLLTQFNQGTTGGKFSFRGFNGEGNVNAAKLLIDGVPSNSNDGNMPYIDMVFPLNIETIEVVRGTSDPRFGLHAIAGSANIITRSGGTFLDMRGSLGGHAAAEGQIVAGLERGAFTQNYQIAWRRSDGYRRHGASQRLSLSGKWGLALSEQVKLGLIARAYDADAQEAGYLTFADSRANPRMTNPYNASDGDDRSMRQFALTLDAAFSDHLAWTAKAWHNRLRDDRFVKFSAGASQQRRQTAEDHTGISTALHWHGDLANMPLMLEAGGDAEWQDNRSLRWLTVLRAPTSQTRNQQFDLSVAGAYVQAVLEPAPWLRLTPAWRIDRVGGSFRNRLNGSRAPINKYGTISQPKLSIAVLPVDGVTLYGNWGKTFQIGLGSGAYLIPPRLIDLKPSINKGWEIGTKFSLGDLLEARLAWWQQTATGEIARKLNDPLGDFENVGATRRKGVDAQVSLRPAKGLALWGSLSRQKATIVVPPPATPQFAGNAIDHVPHRLWSGGVDYQPIDALTLSLTGRGQSSYFLTSANAEGKWGRMAVFDASATVRINAAVELGLSLRNLGDSYAEYVWWDGAQSLHSPAEGRTATLSARLRF